jgi:hypothetical protein
MSSMCVLACGSSFKCLKFNLSEYFRNYSFWRLENQVFTSNRTLKKMQTGNPNAHEMVTEAVSFGFVPIPLIEGKRPGVSGWQKTTIDTCNENFENLGWDRNVGVITGASSGIFVLDIDVQDNGMECWAELVTEYCEGVAPVTPCVRTGSGGMLDKQVQSAMGCQSGH